VSRDKRRAILDAATRMFSQHGVRRASVDLIAERAQVAKPTIYAHFGSKEDLFAAVCADVGERIVAAAKTAAAADASLVDRITAVLAAKFSVVFELVLSSPYAEELLRPESPAAQTTIGLADAAYRRVLGDVVAGAVRGRELDLRRLGVGATELTTQLMQIGYGASYGAASVDDQKENLRALVASMLRAATPHASRAPRPTPRRRRTTPRK
jgi:AcrR family transcriptional regulator